VTDGSRVLGLGDLGIGGLGISIGKLDLYVAAGGFHPKRVLPVVLDVGTNNEALRHDPRYLGMREARLEGDDYYSLIDEFMAAIKLRWPTALVQFEDFQSKHAIKLLMRYKKEYLMFNDDIQGTAATVLAGLYGAMKVRGLAPADLKNQVFVVAGAGSAGSGVMLTIRNAIIRRHGLTKEEANKRFYIIDQDGLITKGRKNLAEMEDLFYDLSSFAVDDASLEGLSLIDTINRVKPNVLIGLSAVGGLFNQEVLTAMNQNEAPPIIFPLSNPTSRSECTAKQAQEATGGRCIFASGTGFDDVEIDGKVIASSQCNNSTAGLPFEPEIEVGRVVASSQCNNRYIFPGLALGAALGQTGVVTNAMINRAAEALVELIDEDDLARRATFPEKADIREISCHLAAKVFMQAVEEGLVVANKEMLESLQHGGEKELKTYIYRKMWYPDYRPFVYRP